VYRHYFVSLRILLEPISNRFSQVDTERFTFYYSKQNL
jgi:hypothetical protein